MDYSIAQLTTVADCDFLITESARTRADLDNKIYTMTRKGQNTGGTSITIEGEIVCIKVTVKSLLHLWVRRPNYRGGKRSNTRHSERLCFKPAHV